MEAYAHTRLPTHCLRPRYYIPFFSWPNEHTLKLLKLPFSASIFHCWKKNSCFCCWVFKNVFFVLLDFVVLFLFHFILLQNCYCCFFHSFSLLLVSFFYFNLLFCACHWICTPYTLAYGYDMIDLWCAFDLSAFFFLYFGFFSVYFVFFCLSTHFKIVS